MQKQSRLSISVSIVLLLILTACGSLWDFDIAKVLYIGQTPSENLFGIIFSYIGIIPTFVGWSFLGSSIFFLSKKNIPDSKKRRWLIAFAVLLFLLSFFYFCNTLYFSNANIYKMHFAVAYSIGTAVICGAAYLGYKLTKKVEGTELLNKVLFLAAVSLFTLIIISFAKELMCRPRFRLVLALDDVSYFKSWWQSGRAIKASLGADIVTDEFASFPSGHSAYSMFAVFLFPAFTDYVGSADKHKPLLFAMGFIWWAVTALSRLTIGAHYLTDVTIAGLVTILAYLSLSAIRRIYTKRKNI